MTDEPRAAGPVAVPVSRRLFVLGGAATVLTACGASMSPVTSSSVTSPSVSSSPVTSSAGPSQNSTGWLQDAPIDVAMSFGGTDQSPVIELKGSLGSYPLELEITPRHDPGSAQTESCTGSVGASDFDVTITYDEGGYYQRSWEGPVDNDQVAIRVTESSDPGQYAFTGTLGANTVSGTTADTYPTATLSGSFGDGHFTFDYTDTNDPDLPTKQVRGSIAAGGSSGAVAVTVKAGVGAVSGQGTLLSYSGSVSGPMPWLVLALVFDASRLLT